MPASSLALTVKRGFDSHGGTTPPPPPPPGEHTKACDSTIAERVARGIELLTDHGYDLAEIDLESLDLERDEYCVLGQLFGEYADGLDALGLYSGDAHGFFIHGDDLYNWSILTDEWRTQLTALRTVAVQS